MLFDYLAGGGQVIEEESGRRAEQRLLAATTKRNSFGRVFVCRCRAHLHKRTPAHRCNALSGPEPAYLNRRT